MSKNPLNIVSVEENKSKGSVNKTNKRVERQARIDRLWKENPEKFDPNRNVMERERVRRTLEFLRKYVDPSDRLAVDLGCALGHFTIGLRDAGAKVHAVDISSIPLNKLKEGDCTRIEIKQDYLPKSVLPDDTYDIVFATDLIAFLDSNEYRLFFSELARIINAEGHLICSTPIDIYSETALQNFADLASTEFDIHHWSFSYHRLYLALKNFFKAPSRFVKGWKNPQYRQQALDERSSLSRWWYKLNSTAIPSVFWSIIQVFTYPILSLLNKSTSTLLFLEKVSKFFWNDAGISHAIFIGKRRPIIPPTDQEHQPREMKHKKQVWE